MAAARGDSTANKVAHCLNTMTLLNMRNLASEDVLNELMNDYFVTRLIGDDSDSSGDDVMHLSSMTSSSRKGQQKSIIVCAH